MGGRSSLREQPIVLSTAQRACAMLRSDGVNGVQVSILHWPRTGPEHPSARGLNVVLAGIVVLRKSLIRLFRDL